MANTTIFGQDTNKNLAQKSICAPVGEIFFFAKSTPPEHALACDGAAVSRAAYPELFGAIGTTFGAGNGSTTFNLPDLRGRFVRGTGGNAAALGVAQGDAIRNITGSLTLIMDNETLLDSEGNGAGAIKELTRVGAVVVGNRGPYSGWCGFSLDASLVVPTADENRPINVALLPCIIFE